MRKSRIMALVLLLATVLLMAWVGVTQAQCANGDLGTTGDDIEDCVSGIDRAHTGDDGNDTINVATGVTLTTLAANITGDGLQAEGAPYTATASGNDTFNIDGTITCGIASGSPALIGDNTATAANNPPAGDPTGNDTFNLNSSSVVTCNIFGDNRDATTGVEYTGTNAGIIGTGNDTFNVSGTFTGTAFGQTGDDQFTLNLGTYTAGSWSGGASLGTSTFNAGETFETAGDRVTLTISTDDDAFYTHLVNNCGASTSGGAGANMATECTITVGGQSYVLLGFEMYQANVTYIGTTNPFGDEDGDGVLNNADACPTTPGVVANSGCPADVVAPPIVTPVAPTTDGGGGGGGDSGGGGSVTVVLVLVPVAPAKVGNAFVGGGILALGNIRIRQTPDLGGVVLGQIPWGTIVTVLKDNPSKEWVFIRYGAIEGWVSANWFVLPNGDTLYSPEELGLGFIIPANGARAVGNVRMRSQPNLGAAVVGQVPWGRIVTILDEDPTGLWWLISFRGTQAWVSNEWFEIPDGSIYTPYGGFFTPGEVPAEEYVLDLSDVHAASGTAVALAPVRLRFAPTLAAPRMGLVDWGDVVVIRGVDSTGNWWLVDYDGTSGWVANEWFVRQ